MKLKHLIFPIIILLAINLAHNNTKVSIGSIFSVSYQDTNALLSGSYPSLLEYGVYEVTYFRPIWHWSYIFHSKVIVKYRNGHKDVFNGAFFGSNGPMYANIRVNKGGQVTFSRLGGFKIKDTRSEQLKLGKFFTERLIMDIKTKKLMMK